MMEKVAHGAGAASAYFIVEQEFPGVTSGSRMTTAWTGGGVTVHEIAPAGHDVYPHWPVTAPPSGPARGPVLGNAAHL